MFSSLHNQSSLLGHLKLFSNHHCNQRSCSSRCRSMGFLNCSFSIGFGLFLACLIALICHKLNVCSSKTLDKSYSCTNLCQTISKLTLAAHPSPLAVQITQHVLDQKSLDGHTLVGCLLHRLAFYSIKQSFAVCHHCAFISMKLITGFTQAAAGILQKL